MGMTGTSNIRHRTSNDAAGVVKCSCPSNQLCLGHIRVASPFNANLRGGAVAREDRHVGPQRIYLFPDSPEEQFRIATRQIPATDSAGKENVSAEEDLLF